MKNHPIFICGDEITFSLMTTRISRIPSYRTVEEHYTEHGFFIGNVDRDYSVMRRFLLGVNVDEVDQSATSGVMITTDGVVSQTYYAPARDSNEQSAAGAIEIAAHPDRIYPLSRAATDHQCIELAIKMGYNTVPKILNMLKRVTLINTSHYVTLSLKDIRAELKKRGAFPTYGYYLKHKERIQDDLDRKAARAAG